MVNELRYFDKGFGTPVGIYHPYQSIATQTISQIIEGERFLQDANYPLTAKLIDGLDGSGSHSIYNQLRNHPDIMTKKFILFAFKVIWLKDCFENIVWTNPSLNSPFAMKSVALMALGESEENVKFLMDTTINAETKLLQTTGIQLKAGKVNVNITRCLFDTKMAAILDGAGGAPCHLCLGKYAYFQKSGLEFSPKFQSITTVA